MSHGAGRLRLAMGAVTIRLTLKVFSNVNDSMNGW